MRADIKKGDGNDLALFFQKTNMKKNKDRSSIDTCRGGDRTKHDDAQLRLH